ncbi:DUF3520 domain-containing protein [bacterium]|nr:DUF3520 domain-containing protein [bacterium]
MNPERPTDPREQMEVRITALLLGEASAFEEAELLEAIKADPELEAYYEDMRRMVKQVQETLQLAPVEHHAEQPKLSEKRREQLANLFQKPARKAIKLISPAERAQRISTLQKIGAIAAAIVILVVVVGTLISPKFPGQVAMFKMEPTDRAIDQLGSAQAPSLKSPEVIERERLHSADKPSNDGNGTDERFLARYGLALSRAKAGRNAEASSPPPPATEPASPAEAPGKPTIYLPGQDIPVDNNLLAYSSPSGSAANSDRRTKSQNGQANTYFFDVDKGKEAIALPAQPPTALPALQIVPDDNSKRAISAGNSLSLSKKVRSVDFEETEQPKAASDLAQRSERKNAGPAMGYSIGAGAEASAVTRQLTTVAEPAVQPAPRMAGRWGAPAQPALPAPKPNLESKSEATVGLGIASANGITTSDLNNSASAYNQDRINQERYARGSRARQYDSRKNLVDVEKSWVRPTTDSGAAAAEVGSDLAPSDSQTFYRTKRQTAQAASATEIAAETPPANRWDFVAGAQLSQEKSANGDGKSAKLDANLYAKETTERSLGENFDSLAAAPAPAELEQKLRESAPVGGLARNGRIVEPAAAAPSPYASAGESLSTVQNTPEPASRNALSDMPALGRLFRSDSNQETEARIFRVDPNNLYRGMEGTVASSLGAGIQNGGGGGGGGGQSAKDNGGSVFAQASIAPGGAQFAQGGQGGGGIGGGGGFAGAGPGGGIRFLTTTNDRSAETAVRGYLESAGVKLNDSSKFFYNDRTGTLFVKTPRSELEKVQNVVEDLNRKQGSARSRFDQLAAGTEAAPKLALNDTAVAVNGPQQAVDEAIRREADKLQVRQKIADKLQNIKLNELIYEGLPLSEVVKNLSAESKRRDPTEQGIPVTLISTNTEPAFSTDPVTGAPVTSTNQAVKDVSSAIVDIRGSNNNITLGQALDAIVAASDQPIEYSIEDNGVVFRSKISTNAIHSANEPEPAATPAPPPTLEPLPEISTKDNAFSTFSLNVSDVSFQLAASSLGNGQMPDGARLRSEEFINAFDYHDPMPAPGQRVAFAWDRARNPFAHNRELLRFSVQTAAAGREPGQPLNLVLLLDNSGSMERSDRVHITEEMLRVLAAELTGYDRVSVIAFARTPRLIVDGMPGGNAEDFLHRVIGLNPDGGTNLEEAMKLAYEIAAKHYQANANNRVILITDGAANLGNIDPQQLRERVIEQRKKGIALDCFGVGWEGYNDNLLEQLSRNGDGRYGFLNDADQAPAQFASQLAGALQVAAADVKAQVEFNPNRVTVYRQIGYQQHQLTKEQFRDNTVDAAEIGAAEAGNALYSVEVNPNGSGPIGTFRVRYRVPSNGQYEEKEWPLEYSPDMPDLESAPPAMRLASSAAAFAEWLANSPYAQTVTPDALEKLLRGVPEVYAPDPRPAKLQTMIQEARSISGK